MKIMVSGGTGMIGSHLVPELQRQGGDVAVLTRDPAKAEARFPGTRAVAGEFLDPFALLPEMRNLDTLFLLLPVIVSEAHEGLNAVALAREAGVKKIVYLSVQQTTAAPFEVPHIGSKQLIESAIRKSGIPYVFLRPSVFMQNDVWYKQSLLDHSIYPQPLGDYGVSSCDVRDIAVAGANALMTDIHNGRSFTIAGPDLITGTSAAADWSRALGKTVHYGGNNLDSWSVSQLSYGMPPWLVYDLKSMYHAWQTDGLTASRAEMHDLTQLLGREARTYQSFIKELSLTWRSDV